MEELFIACKGYAEVEVISFLKETDKDESIYLKVHNFDMTCNACLSPEDAIKLGEHLTAIGKVRLKK